MTKKGKKGKREEQQCENLVNKGSFFGKIKSIFDNFFKVLF